MSTLEDLQDKLANERLPSDVHLIKRESELLLLHIPSNEACPKVSCSLVIYEELAFSMWCQDVPVPKRRVAHILKSEKITSLSQVLNLAAYLKNLSEEGAPAADKIKSCTDQLEELLPTLEEKFQARISFIMEQLLLSTKEPRQQLPELAKGEWVRVSCVHPDPERGVPADSAGPIHYQFSHKS